MRSLILVVNGFGPGFGWLDRWIGECFLKEAFLSLYSLVDQECKSGRCMGGGGRPR